METMCGSGDVAQADAHNVNATHSSRPHALNLAIRPPEEAILRSVDYKREIELSLVVLARRKSAAGKPAACGR
jgi:hypothetical protein